MIWFCWQKAMTGRWEPVCHYGDKPKASDSRLPPVEVPAEYVGVDGTVCLGPVVRLFPLPEVTP